MRPSSACGMPMPVSEMLMAAHGAPARPLTASTRRVMRPPAGVNFEALCRMFEMICTTRAGSTSTTQVCGGSSIVSAISAASIAARCASTALCTTSASAVGRRWSTILPDVIRDTSSRSSMSRTMSVT